MTDPSSALVTPQPSAPIPDIVSTLMHIPDLVSPSHWILYILEKVTDHNPVEWVTEHFSGDWERMSTASSALEHLATYHVRYAEGVIEARQTFEEGWSGQAAGAASAYFSALAESIDAQSVALESYAKDVDAVAQGMKSLQDALIGLIETMMDMVVIAAASAAAAAGTWWTGAGALLGGGATALAIGKAAATWGEIMAMHGKAMIIIDGLLGATTGALGAIHGFTSQPLPAGAYDNRQVP